SYSGAEIVEEKCRAFIRCKEQEGPHPTANRERVRWDGTLRLGFRKDHVNECGWSRKISRFA
ncbi:MAG: hypothetical protein ACREEZ_06965, partial [Stellaceae bacterium]